MDPDLPIRPAIERLQRRVSGLMWRFDANFVARVRENLASFERAATDDAGTLRRAAVAMAVVAGDDGEARFLLTRRAASLKAHRGQWALPGGRLDDGETAVEAALRELDEELGICADPRVVAGALDDYVTRSGYVITPVVLLCERAGAPQPNPAEVASVHLVSLGDLERPGVPRIHHIRESDRPVLSVPLLGTYIHAPTAAVLYQFREVALHGRPTRVAHFEQPVFAWR
jgi:8-oxo-dGTP pyrophosphatase MutT (NUDIX family)